MLSRRALRFALAAVTAGLWTSPSAFAHGIAGNRFFPGTLTFDDPAVADELTVGVSKQKEPAEDGRLVTDKVSAWSFARLLTPDISIGASNGNIWRDRRGFPQATGFDQLDLTVKGKLYTNEPHETLLSASLGLGVGRTGDRGVGGDKPDILKPGVYFGKGFGDLPDSLSWLRPFGLTGAVTADLPLQKDWPIAAAVPGSSYLSATSIPYRETLRYGVSLQYSTLYLTDRFTGGKPKEEPLNQWVPLVEFSFVSPAGEKTSVTMNPGLSYVAKTWQLAGEAIVPLNSEAGRGVGFRTQLLLFLDDLAPSIFGKPLLSDRRVIEVEERW